jgi:type I restriction-modification system DNA methylase subunit
MPKTDIDALVMHLLDLYGVDSSGPLAIHSNQAVSERLKTSVSKVKKMRHDAALKFGGEIQDQAKGRLLAVLSKASLEPDGEKVLLIIEDSLAKNWLQGQLKIHQYIFDYSFNTEIVKVSVMGLFQVLDSVFDAKETDKFRKGYNAAKKKKDTKGRVAAFKYLANKFAEGAAKEAGSGVVKVLKAQIGIV